MNKEDTIFIGEIKEHLSEAGGNRPQSKRKVHRFIRWLGTGTGLMVTVKTIALVTVTGLLIGLMGSYLVTQEMSINVGGGQAPSILIDDIELTDPTYNMPMDTFSDDILLPDETEDFVHTFSSPAWDGNWTVYWDIDQDMTWFDDINSPYYGYYFHTLNETGAPINSINVLRGTTVSVTFRHQLDKHFQTIGNDTIPFKLILNVEPFNFPPAGHNFSVTLPWAIWTTYDAINLSEIIDNENDPLTITAIQPDTSLIMIRITNNKIELYTGSGSSFYDVPIWFDVSDGTSTIRLFVFCSKN